MMEFNEKNWKDCLDSLGFKEGKNISFGGMVVYDDRDVPLWTYTTEEEKEKLYIFFNGAVYWKVHELFK